MISSWPQAPALRRLLFLFGNLAVGLTIFFAGVLPVSELFAEREQEILQQRKALARLRAVAAREADVRSQSSAAALDDGEFLTGKTDGAIGADLQARLKRMVETAGAKLRSVRPMPPRTEAQMRYIGSHIEVLGSIAAVQRTVHAIESAKPYLFVTGGTIRLSPTVGQGAGMPQEPAIEAQLDVFGAVRIEAPER
jgi:hypothetical protein